MPKEMIIPDPDRKPPGFSPATKIGNMVFVSGHTGTDADGHVGNMEEQAQQTARHASQSGIGHGRIFSRNRSFDGPE